MRTRKKSLRLIERIVREARDFERLDSLYGQTGGSLERDEALIKLHDTKQDLLSYIHDERGEAREDRTE